MANESLRWGQRGGKGKEETLPRLYIAHYLMEWGMGMRLTLPMFQAFERTGGDLCYRASSQSSSSSLSLCWPCGWGLGAGRERGGDRGGGRGRERGGGRVRDRERKGERE